MCICKGPSSPGRSSGEHTTPGTRPAGPEPAACPIREHESRRPEPRLKATSPSGFGTLRTARNFLSWESFRESPLEPAEGSGARRLGSVAWVPTSHAHSVADTDSPGASQGAQRQECGLPSGIVARLAGRVGPQPVAARQRRAGEAFTWQRAAHGLSAAHTH